MQFLQVLNKTKFDIWTAGATTEGNLQLVAFFFGIKFDNWCCMSFYVYVLYSAGYNKIYVGYTADLHARLESHNLLAKKGFTIK